MTRVTGPEVRAAAKFLARRKILTEEISPRRFAMAAKDLDTGFSNTLKFLGDLPIEDPGGQREPVDDN